MRTTSAVALAAVLLLASRAGPVLAAPSEQVPVGVRAIAMGSAFSAVADEASALFWNPAGLPRIGHQEISGTHADLYGSGIQDNLVSFLLPLAPKHAVAADWYHSGFGDDELDFGENRFAVAYGFALNSLVSAGVTAKYLTRNTQLDGATVRRGWGVGLDLGVLVSPVERLRLALVAQDLTDTRVDYSEGGSAVVYPRNVRFGSGYSFGRWGTVALDVDDRYHLGGEGRPLEPIAVRAGLERDRDGEKEVVFTAGLGVKAGIFRVDYALVQHPNLDATHHFGVAMEFNFNPTQVRIEEVKTDDLYGSLYKSYDHEPFGRAYVRNLQDRPVDAVLKVNVPGLMDAPSETPIRLRPRERVEVPLTAVFDGRLVAQAGDGPVPIQLAASYQGVRLVREHRKKTTGYLYAPGAINWNRGVEQAGAFVTVGDAVVRGLAEEAVRAAAESPAESFGGESIARAAAVFEAAGALGIAYVPDPNNPYKTVSADRKAVDSVRYPRQTLAARAGDCDDTSVLLAALLGSVGISTKLVDVPGHLFVLFDSGLPEKNRLALGLDDSLSVVSGGQVWIPLETVALGKGFAEAWRVGAETYATYAARGEVALVDVDSALVRYEPAEPPAAEIRAGAPDGTVLRTRIERSAQSLAAWREEHLATRYGEVRRNLARSPGALTEIARAYFLAGSLEAAEGLLLEALAADSSSVRARNDLGVVQLALGRGARAVASLERAAAADPRDAGVRLNLALARHAAGDAARGARDLTAAVEQAGGYENACRLLGMPPEAAPSRAGAGEVVPDGVRGLLRAAAAGAALPPVKTDAALWRHLYWK